MFLKADSVRRQCLISIHLALQIKIYFLCFHLYNPRCCIKAQAYNALLCFHGWSLLVETCT